MVAYDEQQQKIDEFVSQMYELFGGAHLVLRILRRPKVYEKLFNMAHSDVLTFVQKGYKDYLLQQLTETMERDQRNDYKRFEENGFEMDFFLLRIVTEFANTPKVFTREELTITKADWRLVLDDSMSKCSMIRASIRYKIESVFYRWCACCLCSSS